MTRQIFLDTETTGLSPDSGDRIIEIGCVEMLNRRLTGRHLHYYINPERPNSEDAVKVHGLTDEFLADKPVFASLADDILAYCQGAEIVISTDKGLCGGLNTNILRAVTNRMREWEADGVSTRSVAIGNKGMAFLGRIGALAASVSYCSSIYHA